MSSISLRLFTETTESMGILYGSYKGLLEVINNFMDKVDDSVDELTDDPEESDIDLREDIEKFKSDIQKNFSPDAISMNSIKSDINKVKEFRTKLDKILTRLTSLKNRVSFGGNYFRAVINRPKVYSKKIDPESYTHINKNIRNVDRALDWVEKALIDLYNMVDQDLNVLNIVNRVYAKNRVYESGIVEDTTNNVLPMLPSGMTESPAIVNTRNKKTGEPPQYLSRNHDLGDDFLDDKPGDDADPKSFERPSAKNNTNDMSDVDEDDTDDEVVDDVKQPGSVTNPVNNYYYYTYNNSLNKNSHSFNKDSENSTDRHDHHDSHDRYDKHDDHSVHNTTRRTSNDNSTGRRIHSNDYNGDPATGTSVNESKNPWELNLNIKPTAYTEGLMDTLKKGISKGVSKIRMLFAKKTLANVQKMDAPSVSRKLIPLTLVGTNIPVQINGSSKLESVDYNEIITEGLFGPSFMSSDELKKAVDSLRKKFNAEIIFAEGGKTLIDDMIINQIIGPASVVLSDRESINRIASGSVQGMQMKSRFNSDEKLDKVIIVNLGMLTSTFRIKNIKQLETIISHEYGHVLTFDQLTDDDWYAYTMKRNMLSGVLNLLDQMSVSKSGTHIITTQTYADIQLYYHKLKVEAIANKAAGVNPIELIKAFTGFKPTGKIAGVNLDAIVEWKIPAYMRSICKKTLAGQELSYDETLQSIDASIELYSRVYTDPSIRDTVINGLKAQKKGFMILHNHNESVYTEEVGDADDLKPESDHPIKDTFMDIDRELTKGHQKAKKRVQDIKNVGRAIAKPVVRTKQWISNMIQNWKDMDETKIKERMADPHARKNLFSAIGAAIKVGSLAKAGILLNPVFLFLTITRGIGKNKREYRIRNEMIGELKAEIEIIKEKIKDADDKGDKKSKYKLMRLQNEIEKKLLRVGGSKGWKKII